MGEAQGVESGRVASRRSTFGIKTLMLAVACCSAICWVAYVVREGMVPALGWARALRSGAQGQRALS